MYNLPEVSESTQRLERLVRKEKDARIQRRFQMLLLLKTGEAESRSAQLSSQVRKKAEAFLNDVDQRMRSGQR